jgi:hypothetical protein
MEAICSSETSVDFERTTRRHVSEDSIFIDSHLLNKALSTALLT